MKSNRARNKEYEFWYWKNDDNYFHHEDGPAIEYDNGTKFWYINGKLHNNVGPAVEYSDGRVYYYLDDIMYNYSDWLIIVRTKKLEELLNEK